MNKKTASGFGSNSRTSKTSVNRSKNDLMELVKKADKFLKKGRIDKSEMIYIKVVKSNLLKPEPYINLSRIYRHTNRHRKAIEILQKSTILIKDSINHFIELASVFRELNQNQKSLRCLLEAIEIEPQNQNLLRLIASSANESGQFSLAISTLKKIFKLQPNDHFLLIDIAKIYKKNNNNINAIKFYTKALEKDPKNEEVLMEIANSYQQLGDFHISLKYFEELNSLNPDNEEALYGLGLTNKFLNNYKSAISAFKKSILIKPGFTKAISELISCVSHSCDWSILEENLFQLEKLGLNKDPVSPFSFLAIEDNPNRHLKRAEVLCEKLYKREENRIKFKQKDKLKIGYFSSDFFNHPTMHLMERIFMLHDKSKIDLYIYSYDIFEDETTKRLKDYAYKFRNISQLSELDCVNIARNDEIDIAVDLKGHCFNSKLEIFSHRVAPIQISYLGYPGSTGLKSMDYIIADKTLIPDGYEKYYSEKIIYMPYTYQCNDNEKLISKRKFKKSDCGIDNSAFVFTCFNNNNKITKEAFEIWMKLLDNVEGSVLWLFKSSETASENLRNEALKKKVDPNRIIFAEEIPLDEHLARHSCGDLFLDTFYYNAHTTASDALWAGMPVLTLPGKSFSSRVGASLLNALDIKELICINKEDYYQKALDLAKNPEKLKSIKDEIIYKREKSPLFDSRKFTKDLESEYFKLISKNY